MAGVVLSRPVPVVRDERLWEVACAGKESFPSESSAGAVLAMTRRWGGGQKTCWLNIYRCSQCGQFHIGKTGRGY